ncbi:MAG: HD domain-containing protein, partial [bacterium]
RIINLAKSGSYHPLVVGGAVRDLILDRKISDIDIVTEKSGTAKKLASDFARATNRKLIEYTHEQTIYRVVAQNQPQIDFTDPVGGTLESDLARRDFTINAMALDLTGENAGVIVDPSNGLDDLKNGIIRMSNENVFDDDPLRMLRAFRFAAELGFKIDPDTFDAIKPRVVKLGGVAGERIQLELLAIMAPDGLSDRIIPMDDAGIWDVLFPEIGKQKNCDQNAYHHLNVWEHSLETIRELEKILTFDEKIFEPFRERLREYIDYVYPSGHKRVSLMKLAMFLHDIAKPHCKGAREDGRITFIGHEKLGSEFVYDYLDRLKFPNYEKDFVRDIIKGHLRPIAVSMEQANKFKAAYGFVKAYGDTSTAITIISLADRYSAQGPLVTEEINDSHREAVRFLLECFYERSGVAVRPPQIIDGNTLIKELKIQSGPIIGYLINRVREEQVMGQLKTKEDALEFCRRIISGEEKPDEIVEEPDDKTGLREEFD